MIIPSAGTTDTGRYYETAFATRCWHRIVRIDEVEREYSALELARQTHGWRPKGVHGVYFLNIAVPVGETGNISLDFDLEGYTMTTYITMDNSISGRFLPPTHLSRLDEYLEHASTPELLTALVQLIKEVKLAAKLLGIVV